MKVPGKIPAMERDIMLVIWSAGGDSVTSNYIMENIGKNWVKPTLLKLLDRLCDRGYLERSKSGRLNVYTPLVTKEDYLKYESRNFLDHLYDSSLTKMVASLYDGDCVSEEEWRELKRFIEER